LALACSSSRLPQDPPLQQHWQQKQQQLLPPMGQLAVLLQASAAGLQRATKQQLANELLARLQWLLRAAVHQPILQCQAANS
jgi:hypothetical protein